MEPDTVTVEHDDAYIWVQLDRPDHRNAINGRMLDELEAVLRDAVDDEETRCIILHGSADTFCAGADLEEMSDWDGKDAQAASQQAQEVTALLSSPAIISVAAIDGYCLGGGLELALGCDFRVAVEGSSFGQPEVTLGLVPGFGATARLPGLIGPQDARELVLSGRTIDVAEAADIGLVDHLLDAGTDLRTGAQAFAERFLEGTSPTAQAQAKELLQEGCDGDLETALRQEREGFVGLFGTPDQEEGLAAFREGREPDFGDDQHG